MSVQGIDVSQANGNIDWRAVARAGVDFAICKVSEGDWIDPTFSRARVHAIRAAGIIPGGYVFMRPRPGRTGAQEVNIFFEHAHDAGLWHADKGTVKDVRPVLDFEASSFDVGTRAGRNATKRYIASAVERILDLTHGRHPIIYTGFFWRDAMHNPRNGHRCPLWYPEYPARDDGRAVHGPTASLVPRAWRKAGVAIHQYSEHGTVPGVGGHVDRDRYLLGDRAHFLRHQCI